MRVINACILAGMTLAVSAAFAVHAEDGSELPKITILPCKTTCANSVAPKALDHWSHYPLSVAQGNESFVEGFVLLRITVGTDGHVHDIHLLKFLGPQAFVASAKADVQDWTYTPATLDGHPVEEVHNLLVKYDFQKDAVGFARTWTVVVYQKAMALIQAGKPDEAVTVLRAQLAKPELNFYERGMLSFPIGDIALAREDYSQAREIVEIPMFVGLDELPPVVQQELYHIRIKADLHLGDMVDALRSLSGLKALKDHGATEDMERLVASERAKYDALPEIPLTSRIPVDSSEVELGLYRRSFRFQIDSGKLTKFTMACKQQAISSPITATAQWHVPANWSDCDLYIEGDPGTNFTILESAG